MNRISDFCISIRGTQHSFGKPEVMGIINATPDSFYEASRKQTESAIVGRARQILDEGGTIIDVGACSTRPDSTPVSCEEEQKRLLAALSAIRAALPDAIISVDTFRPEVAARALRDFGAEIINDVGSPDDSDNSRRKAIIELAASEGAAYVLTSRQSSIETVSNDFSEGIALLEQIGTSNAILDPGYGFGKTLEENYSLLAHQRELLRFRRPLLIGISRKRMIRQPLNLENPEQALNGTTAAHVIALERGAHILRVHDVKAAAEAVKIQQQVKDVY